MIRLKSAPVVIGIGRELPVKINALSLRDPISPSHTVFVDLPQFQP